MQIQWNGGTGTDTVIYTGNATAANIEGSGTGTSTGLAINLGATALTNANVLGTSTQSLAGSLTSVTTGQVAYLFGASAPTNSAVVDTLTDVENVTVTDGINYIAGRLEPIRSQVEQALIQSRPVTVMT